MQNYTEQQLDRMTITQIATAYNQLVPADKAVVKFRYRHAAKQRYLQAPADVRSTTITLDMPSSDDPAAFVKAARTSLDTWLAERGYLGPRGRRGREQVKGLTARLRALFPDVGVAISEAELKAELAAYEWRDVLRLISREKCDQRRGIAGPVHIERVGDGFRRMG